MRVCVCLVKDGTLHISSLLICIDFSTCLLMFATQWDATANSLHVKSATLSITERFPNQYTQQPVFSSEDYRGTIQALYFYGSSSFRIGTKYHATILIRN